MSQNNSSPAPNMDLTTGTLYTYTLILTLMQQFYSTIGFIFDASIVYVTVKNKWENSWILFISWKKIFFKDHYIKVMVIC